MATAMIIEKTATNPIRHRRRNVASPSEPFNGRYNVATQFAQTYVKELQGLLDLLPAQEIDRVCDVLYQAYQKNRTVYLFGNGGSAALASHMACDLGKGTFAPNHVPLPGVKRFKVLSLTDNVPMVTAWANDTAYDNVFAEQLANFIEAGDVAFGISGSGNSINILRALTLAKQCQAITIALAGFHGGKVRSLVDYPVIVRCNNMQQVEDIHLVIAHIVFLNLQQRICSQV